MSTFETIYVIGHTIGSFLLLMIQFWAVKNYVVPFAKKVYHFIKRKGRILLSLL